MNGLNIIFKIKESNFFENKILSKRDKIDIDKKKKEPHDTKKSKYFIRHNDDDDDHDDDDDAIRPLCIRLPDIIGNVKCFNSVF